MSIIERKELENAFSKMETDTDKCNTMLGFAFDSAYRTLLEFNSKQIALGSTEHCVKQLCLSLLALAAQAERHKALDIRLCLDLARKSDNYVEYDRGKNNVLPIR